MIRVMQLIVGSGIVLDFYICLYLKIYRLRIFVFQVE